MTIDIQIAGENALIVYFGEGLSDHVSQHIQSVAGGLSAWVGSLLIDMVPSYASLMVIFNPALTDHLRVRQLIREAAQDARVQGMQTPSRLITLPVYYGAQAAPDLARLAENAGLSCQQVIDLHSAMEYRVYAIGFAPGFAYLGEVDARI
ncbi:MAG: carboxyltransferase domain-containing protein, partial [Bermanella sp.]